MTLRYFCAFFVFVALQVAAQENAHVLESTTKYVVDGNKNIAIEKFRRVKIFNEEGYRQAMFVDYIDEFRKIDAVKIEVLDQQGKKIKTLRRSDALEIGFNPSYEINDAKTVVLDPKYQNYPFVVEVSSRIELNGFISLPAWVPRDEFGVGIDKASLTIDYPSDVLIHFKEEFVKAVVADGNGRRVRSYEVVNIPAIARKIRYEDFYKDQPKVHVAPEKFWLDDTAGSNASWREFGNWFCNLNDTGYKLSAATRSYIDDLKTKDKVTIVRSIYEYMQDKTRYVSIQLGIGGFKSMPTEEVEEFGYGDCKALSTYTRHMLDYAGIKANYILVRAGRDVPDVESDFPSNQFNHVFLGVPMEKDTLFLECTSQESPFNYQGTFTDDRNVLWIEKNNSRIIRPRSDGLKANKQTTVADVTLDSLGNASTKLSINNRGIFFDELMLYKSAPPDFVEKHNHDKFAFADFAIRDFKYDQPRRSEAVFNSSYALNITHLARVADTKMILPLMMTTPFEKYFLHDDLMGYCSVKRSMEISDEVSVDLPGSYWPYQLPAGEVIESKMGTYRLSVEMDDKKLRIRRSFVLHKGDFRGADYEGLKDFLRRVAKLENKRLVLNSKT